MLKRLLGIALVALVAAGCSANKYCLGELEYQNAPSVPPIQGAKGLELPPSARALSIPPVPENPVPFGETYKDADGDEQARCLDIPPAMPTLAGADLAPAPAAPEPKPKAPAKPLSKKRPQPSKPADPEVEG